MSAVYQNNKIIGFPHINFYVARDTFLQVDDFL